MQKQELLYSGKAKSLFTTDDENLLIAEFRDDTTAFDGEKHQQLSGKGETNLAISTHLMNEIENKGIPTHFVKSLSSTECVVKKLKMLPVECVIRNIATGSLCRRLGVQQGLNLRPPLFELFLKNDDLHDPLINADHAIAFGWATESQIATMREYTFKLNDILREVFSNAGLILVDAKFEFGVHDGNIYVGDEISPDSCRIWDALTKESLDKDRFRQDLGKVVASYQEIALRLGISLPA